MFDDIALIIIRDVIRAEQSVVADSDVINHIDETVWPSLGEQCISVYPSAIAQTTSPDEHEALDYYCGFSIGVTIRTGRYPEDRMYKTAAVQWALPLMRTIITIIRKERYRIQRDINEALPAKFPPLAGWKLVEPYRFQSGDLTFEKKSPAHWRGRQHQFSTTFKEEGEVDEKHFGVFCSANWANGRYMASLLDGSPVLA